MTQYFTDKLQVHHLLQDKCNQARYILLNECDLAKPVPVLSSTLNFPVIVKPRYGSGSRGVNVAYTQDDLQRAVDIASQEFNPLPGLPKDLLIEEFLSGTEYSCYGILLNHQLYAPTVIKKSKLTSLPYRQEIAYFTSPTDPKESVRQAVIEQVQSVAKLLHMNDCLVVSDVLLSDNQPYVLDIAGRHCGYNLIKFLKYQNIDYLQLWYRYILNRQAPDSQLLNWHQHTSCSSFYMHFLQLPIGIVRKVPSLQQVQKLVSNIIGTDQSLVEFNCKLKPHDVIQIEHDGRICSNGYIILRDLDCSLCESMVQKLLELFTIEPFASKGNSNNKPSTQRNYFNQDASTGHVCKQDNATFAYQLIEPEKLQSATDNERNIMCLGISQETLSFILSGVKAGYNVIAVGQKDEEAEQELLALLSEYNKTLPNLEQTQVYKISTDSLLNS